MQSIPWYVWVAWVVAFSAVAFLGGGCSGILQDQPANMEQNLTPDSVAKAPSQVPPSAPPAVDVSKARRVGWKPRHATPAGDVVEGHAIEITPTPLTPEVVAPAAVIPRAPRFVTPSMNGTAAGATRSRSSQEPAAPISQPIPALPIQPLLGGQGGMPYVPAAP